MGEYPVNLIRWMWRVFFDDYTPSPTVESSDAVPAWKINHRCNLNTEVERGHWLGLRRGWGGRCRVCGRTWEIT